MEWIDFLHVDTDSQKFKADQKFMGWAWSKMDVTKKAKSWFSDFWGGLVKDGSGLLVHETLKTLVLCLKNEYMKWADVLNADSDAIVSG